MSSRHLKLALTFTIVTSTAAVVGPRLGEWITQDDTLAWQLLPWGLLGACGLGFYLWARRASPPS